MEDISKLTDEQLQQMLAEARAKEEAEQRLQSMTKEELNSLYKQSLGEDTPQFVSGFDEKTLGQYITGVLPDAGSIIGGTVGATLTRSPAGGAYGASLGYGSGKVIQNYLEGAPVADKELFMGMIQEAALDVSGAKVGQVFADAYRSITNNPVMDKLNPLKPSEIRQFYTKKKLQEKLAEQGSGLSLAQVMPESGFVQNMAGAAEAAVSPSRILKELEEGQNAYLQSEISKIKKVGKDMKGRQLGVAVQNMIERTREATEKYHDKLFMDLAEQGKTTTVDLADVKKYARVVKKKALQGVKSVEGKGKPTNWLDPKVQEFVALVNQLETTQNFNVAYDKLKIIKKKIAQVKANPENKPIVRDLVKIEKAFEDSIINSSDNPKIAEMYRGLMKSYSGTMDVTFSNVAQRLFDEDAPEVVAKMLFSDNRAMTNFDEFKRVVDLGAKHKEKGGKPIINALRKGWLSSTMKNPKDPEKAMSRLRSALEDTDKREVYDYLMDDKTKRKIKVLLDEFDVLSQRPNKELSLVVRGQQTAGATQTVQGAGLGGKFMGAVRAVLPTKLPEVLANQVRVNDLLKLSELAKRIDKLTLAGTKSRLDKEMKGRMTTQFFGLLNQLTQTGQEIQNDYYESEYAPQIEQARNMLFGAAQQERNIDTIPR